MYCTDTDRDDVIRLNSKGADAHRRCFLVRDRISEALELEFGGWFAPPLPEDDEGATSTRDLAAHAA